MHRVMLVFVAACAAEPTPPPPDHELLGSWRYVPQDPTTPADDRQVLVFAADGRYSIREGDELQTGAFEIAGDALTLHTSRGFVTTGVAITSTHLLVDALFPAGDNAGLVGTWIGAQSSAVADTQIELVLRADGTAHLSQTGSLADDIDATWVQQEPYAVLTFAGTTRPKLFPALPGIAIGEWLYERAP